MPNRTERFWYPFTATTVIARRLVPLLLFTLGIGLFLWAGREYYFWKRPWTVAPAALLGLLSWLAAGYFFSLLPEVRADESGLHVRRWGLFWRHLSWEAVADGQQTAQIDLLGWTEELYSVYVWRIGRGRDRVQPNWRRATRRAFRFSGHIRNSQRLLALIKDHSASSSPET